MKIPPVVKIADANYIYKMKKSDFTKIPILKRSYLTDTFDCLVLLPRRTSDYHERVKNIDYILCKDNTAIHRIVCDSNKICLHGGVESNIKLDVMPLQTDTDFKSQFNIGSLLFNNKSKITWNMFYLNESNLLCISAKEYSLYVSYLSLTPPVFDNTVDDIAYVKTKPEGVFDIYPIKEKEQTYSLT